MLHVRVVLMFLMWKKYFIYREQELVDEIHIFDIHSLHCVIKIPASHILHSKKITAAQKVFLN